MTNSTSDYSLKVDGVTGVCPSDEAHTKQNIADKKTPVLSCSAMDEIYVSEIMTKNVTACSPDTQIKDVIKILSRNCISCLVITENDEPVGIITERDLVAIMEELLNDVARDYLPIVHFMTSPTLTIRSHIILQEAVKFAINKNIRHLPVVDENNKLVGLLTQTNMVRSLSYIAFILSSKS